MRLDHTPPDHPGECYYTTPHTPIIVRYAFLIVAYRKRFQHGSNFGSLSTVFVFLVVVVIITGDTIAKN